MAMGTIPIVTPDVTIGSYMDPPKENVHYIRAKTPIELTHKISNISKDQWEIMSKACYDWYQDNVYSNNCWNKILENILYG